MKYKIVKNKKKKNSSLLNVFITLVNESESGCLCTKSSAPPDFLFLLILFINHNRDLTLKLLENLTTRYVGGKSEVLFSTLFFAIRCTLLAIAKYVSTFLETNKSIKRKKSRLRNDSRRNIIHRRI